ncbi:unnamed protein product [Miscanthus lutarioriparius]|uniref:Retrovirus-related Pol polyprotein from transposon TNT 1-94-like beta-barrel domain-containing protein n=1 Tax=Miscanthus lutarioriparius TaxID=422564 RepID=A0A811QI51_9POAL|nr:unnamed protein product [Miscanthus lutarioriparius]
MEVEAPLPCTEAGGRALLRMCVQSTDRYFFKETGQHVGDVFMMQGSGNGGSGSNSRDNQSSDHDAVDVKSFIVDSGASVHATGDPNLFSHLEDTTTNMRLCTANGSTMDITGRGTVRHHNITLHGVLLVPRLAVNIVSVSKLGELDYTVEFTRTNCFIRDAGTGDLVGEGHLVNGLFELDFLQAPRT